MREADLGEPVHDLRSGEGFRQKHHLRMAVADVGDQPFPKGQGFGVGVVDAEELDAIVDPFLHHVAQFYPE